MHYATGGKSRLRGGAFLLSCLFLLYVLGLFPLNVLYPHEGTYIAVVENWGQNYAISRISRLMAEENTIDVVSVTAPTSMIDLSDHIHYWYFGYPAVIVTNTADHRNPNYHKTSDTIEMLDFNKMAGVVEAVYAAMIGY